MVKAIDKITSEDIRALREFERHARGGIRWRGKLRHAWDDGEYYGVSVYTKEHLKNMRKFLGVSWLRDFKFPKVCPYCGKTTCPRAKNYLDRCDSLMGITDPDCSD
jgi:muconolactone delta-isomerase